MAGGSFVGLLRVRAVRTVSAVIAVNAMSADNVVSTLPVDAHTSWVSRDDASRRSGDTRLPGGVMTGIRGWTTPNSPLCDLGRLLLSRFHPRLPP